MKKLLPFVLVAVWSLSVTAFYLILHWQYFMPLNVYSMATLQTIIIYFSIHVLGIAVLVGLFWWLKKEYPKFSFAIIGILVLFFFMTMLLSGVRFLWTDFGIYNGPDLIQNGQELRAYDGVNLEGDEPYLLNDSLIIDPEKTYWNIWENVGTYFDMLTMKEVFLSNFLILGGQLMGVLLLLLCFYCLGGFVLQRGLKIPLNNLGSFLSSVGLGAIIISLLGFGLAKLSLFSTIPLAVLLVVALMAGAFGPFVSLFKTLKTPLLLKDIPLIDFLLVMLILWLTAWNFIEVTAPLPQDYDDFVLYLNIPNLMTITHTYVTGHIMHAFAFLQAAPMILFKNAALSKTLVWACSALSLFGVFTFAKQFLKSNFKSLLVTLVLALVPTLYVHSYDQTKVEFAMIFFCLLALLNLYFYFNEKSLKWLGLVGLFMGFAVTIKISALLLVPIIFVILLWDLAGFWTALFLYFLTLLLFFLGYLPSIPTALSSSVLLYISAILALFCLIFAIIKKQIIPFKLWKPILTLALGIIIPILPWAISNIFSAPIENFNLNYVFSDQNINAPTIDWAALDIEPSLCSDIKIGGEKADYERYINERPLFLQILLAPWDVTFYMSNQFPATNIGFIFLALCPILLFITPFNKKSKSFKYFAVCGAGFWFLWILVGGNVIWYGFAGVTFLAIWLTGVIEAFWDSYKWTRVFALVFCVMWILVNFYFRSNFFFGRMPSYMPYLGGAIGIQEYVEFNYPGIGHALSILNANADQKIYLTDVAPLYFFISDNDNRVFVDHFSETLNCLYKEKDAELLDSRLKEAGFTYIVVSPPKTAPGFPESFYKTHSEILTAIQSKMTLVHNNGSFMVFEP